MTENFWEFFPGKFFRGIFLPERGHGRDGGTGETGRVFWNFPPRPGQKAPRAGLFSFHTSAALYRERGAPQPRGALRAPHWHPGAAYHHFSHTECRSVFSCGTSCRSLSARRVLWKQARRPARNALNGAGRTGRTARAGRVAVHHAAWPVPLGYHDSAPTGRGRRERNMTAWKRKPRARRTLGAMVARLVAAITFAAR